MNWLSHCYTGDVAFEALLGVTLGVALASSAAWGIATRLARHAALRHLVLFSGLICSVAIPALVGLSAAANLELVSIPVFRSDQGRTPASLAPPPTSPVVKPLQRPADVPPAAAQPSQRQSRSEIDRSAEVAAASSATPPPGMSLPSSPPLQRTDSLSRTHLSLRNTATGAMLVWAAGVLLMLARLARSCASVVQLRRTSRPLQDGQPRALLHDVAARLGMRREPLLLVSNRAVTPLAVGFGSPAVVMPAALLEAVGEDELRDILSHEVAHLRRGDQRTVLLQRLAAALYWPIVSIYGLNRELQRAREDLCDNVVLADRDAIRYGETLLHVAELAVEVRRMDAAVAIIGRQGELERRIAGLLDPGRNTMTATSRKSAFLVMFLFIAGGAIASATRLVAAAGATPPGSATEPEAPVVKPDASRDSDDPILAGRFNGRVTGPDGQAVSGARVYLVPTGVSPVQNDILERARTDSDGNFEFHAPDMIETDLDGLPTGRPCFLLATAEGYGPDWIAVRGRTRSQTIRNPIKGTDVSLQLPTDDVPIRGRFLDAEGKPLAGARVRLEQLMIPRQRNLDTYLEYVTQEDSGFMNGPDFEQMLLRQIPLPGMTTEALTDADGNVTLTGLGRDRVAELKVTAPSVVDTRVTVVTREMPEVGTYLIQGKSTQVTYGARFTLPLKRGLSISGLVRDRDTQQAIAGLWVGWESDPMNGLWTGEYTRTTDSDGRFTITGLDPVVLKSDRDRRVVAVSPPGLTWQPAFATVVKGLDVVSEVVIECQRGIPFRLKLVDEQGKPVAAEVTYRDVQPNPLLPAVPYLYDGRWPVGRAAHRGGGIYEGFVLPGPGAVLVSTADRAGFRPAHVDPKAFFAPGRTDWTAQEQISAYGTQDTLSTSQVWVNQHDYAAIVLVNPTQDSGPLELSATVVKDTPRRMTLVDPDGKPVAEAHTQGLTFHPWDSEPPLRAASCLLTGLHPDRVRRITFLKEDRKLIGSLVVRGPDAVPETLVMQPWATVTGRLVDENGQALTNKDADGTRRGPLTISSGGSGTVVNPDPEIGVGIGAETDAEGRFRIDRLVPGQRYSANIYRGGRRPPAAAFENLVLRPGELRDLGDLRVNLSADAKSRTDSGN